MNTAYLFSVCSQCMDGVPSLSDPVRGQMVGLRGMHWLPHLHHEQNWTAGSEDVVQGETLRWAGKTACSLLVPPGRTKDTWPPTRAAAEAEAAAAAGSRAALHMGHPACSAYSAGYARSACCPGQATPRRPWGCCAALCLASAPRTWCDCKDGQTKTISIEKCGVVARHHSVSLHIVLYRDLIDLSAA